MNKITTLILPVLITAVLLTAFFAFLDTPDPVLAQGGGPYYVWSKQALCSNLMDGDGNVVDTDGYMGTIGSSQWYTWTDAQSMGNGEGNNEIDQWFTVCAFGIPASEIPFQYAIGSYGEGGYLLTTNYKVNFVSGSVGDVDTGGESYGGGSAGCRSLGGGITNTVSYSPTTTRWGYQMRTRIFVNESFCDSSTYAEALISFRFGDEEPEPTPTCAGGAGIEVLSDGPVFIPGGAAWVSSYVSGTLPFDRAFVTYVYSDPVDNGSTLWVAGEINDRKTNRRGYSEPYDGINVYTMTVPNRTDPDGVDPSGRKDYDRYGGVDVPPIDLRFATWGDMYLMSACVQEAARPLTPSLLCPDGLEVLTEPLRADDFAGKVWEDTVVITTSQIAVRYTLENPFYPAERLGGGMAVEPGILGKSYWVEGTWASRQYVTFTLPTTGTIFVPNENALLEFRNEGPALTVVSICVLDAIEIMPQLREEECHLINPDFVYGLGGWADDGDVTWDGETGNGVINEDGGGMVWQAPTQDTGTVWKLEIRARAFEAVTGTIMAGTDTDALIAGGAQMYSVDLGESWATYAIDIFVEEQSPRLEGGYVVAAGDNAQVDSVCLMSPDDALPVPECDRPEWNPTGSGDPLYIYLFKYLADWVMYGICMVIRAISIAYNGIIRFLENILLRIPNLDPSDGLLGIPEWINSLVFRMLDWIGYSFAGFFQWLGGVFGDFGLFLGGILEAVLEWIGEQLGFDPFFLLTELDSLWDETLLFWDEVQDEVGSESSDLLLLLQNMGNVMIVLVNGVRGGVTGETIAYIGTDFDGIGEFIWIGVDFLNEAIENTPLTALNIVALAAITLSLVQWTIKKFGETLEFLG